MIKDLVVYVLIRCLAVFVLIVVALQGGFKFRQWRRNTKRSYHVECGDLRPDPKEKFDSPSIPFMIW